MTCSLRRLVDVWKMKCSLHGFVDAYVGLFSVQYTDLVTFIEDHEEFITRIR